MSVQGPVTVRAPLSGRSGARTKNIFTLREMPEVPRVKNDRHDSARIASEGRGPSLAVLALGHCSLVSPRLAVEQHFWCEPRGRALVSRPRLAVDQHFARTGHIAEFLDMRDQREITKCRACGTIHQ